MDFSQFMKSITVTDEVLEDITYLQKHLRLCIEIHQDLAEELYTPEKNKVQNQNDNNLKMKPTRCFALIREFLNDLESEMDDISQKQKFLVNIITESVDKYCQELQAKNASMIVDREVPCGFINRALEYHRMLNKILTPKNVQLRMSEDEIRQRHQEIRSKIVEERNKKYDFELKEKLLKCAILNPLLSKQKKSSNNFSNENECTSNQCDETKCDQAVKKNKKRKMNNSLSEIIKPYPALPLELPPISNPTQDQFLQMFGLVRNEVKNETKVEQRPKRTRRSCNNNQKKDFHYGDFHLVEATIAYNQSRSRSVLQNSNK